MPGGAAVARQHDRQDGGLGLGQPFGAAVAGGVSVATGDPRTGLGVCLAVLLLGVAAAWVSPVLRRARTS
ncbi:hypothetical protein [Lentzea jiangxiensis]|uniref:hypothetical protein n=1 Tax=Lentzea jiangxiensis TaxID=641025 RepID=UPI001FE00736|nr:hypothetical protein [Lentzea jiangxiensis]